MEQFCKVYVYEEIKHSIVSNNWIQLAYTPFETQPREQLLYFSVNTLFQPYI
jgi:hypothetical protein